MALNKTSLKRLEGVHCDLKQIVLIASERCPTPFMVTEGVRTKQRQADLYAQGRTKPGAIVTWTMNSRHIPGKDGTGKAVDLAPLTVGGAIDWNNINGFLAIGRTMMNVAAELGIPIRWGWDWNGDGKLRGQGETDGPHFELLSSKYP